MTALDTTPAAKDATGERRAAARDAYRTSLAEGVPLTGAELGRRFGLSPRWGRLRVAEVHAEAAATGNGWHRGRHVAGEESEHDPARSQRERDRGEASIGRRAEPTPDRTNGSRRHRDRRSASERHPSEDAPTPVTPLVHGITTLAVLAVALVAAIASYDHQRALAEMAGEDWRAWLLPVSVDGLVVAASMSMLVRRRAGMPVGALAWTSLLAGVGASLAANVAAADPTMVGRVVAAWPPLALLLAWELLLQVRSPTAAGREA
jgi:Protein of unknown function (DUF2637)